MSIWSYIALFAVLILISIFATAKAVLGEITELKNEIKKLNKEE